MLMALLYCEEDLIAAAAPACDQMPYGDEYWTDVFAGWVPEGSIFETAYITVNNADLRRRLLLLGFDDDIDGRELALELDAALTPEYLQSRSGHDQAA